MFLAHGLVLKLLTYGMAGTASFFVHVGLPGWLAYLTAAAEVLGGLLLILGVQARWVALALSPCCWCALIWVHGANGWVFTAPNGGWEYPAYLFVLCLCRCCWGDGPYAAMPSTMPRFLEEPAMKAPLLAARPDPRRGARRSTSSAGKCWCTSTR